MRGGAGAPLNTLKNILTLGNLSLGGIGTLLEFQATWEARTVGWLVAEWPQPPGKIISRTALWQASPVSFVIRGRPVLCYPGQACPELSGAGLSFVIRGRPVLCYPGQACPLLSGAGLSCVIRGRAVLCYPGQAAPATGHPATSGTRDRAPPPDPVLILYSTILQ